MQDILSPCQSVSTDWNLFSIVMHSYLWNNIKNWRALHSLPNISIDLLSTDSIWTEINWADQHRSMLLLITQSWAARGGHPGWDHVMECEPKWCLPFLGSEIECWVFNPYALTFHYSQLKTKDPVKDTKGILRDGESHVITGESHRSGM